MLLHKVALVDFRLYSQGSIKERNEFVQMFGKSIQEFGFVVVEGHGIDSSLIEKAYAQAKDFFQMPLAEKMKSSGADIQGQRGYTCFGVEHAKDSQRPDLKEFWHVGREFFSDQGKKEHYQKNIWPSSKEFKDVFLELYQKLDHFSLELLKALSLFLHLPERALSDMATDGNSILRALHYPPVTADQFHSGAVRSAAHEDINLITILCEATQSGLQILNRQNQWIDIESGPGQMVVDSGDMLSRLTNQVIPSTTHRVINPAGSKNEPRYSMPFFVHPWKRCSLDVLENCVAPSAPVKYPPIFAEEFLLQRLKEIGLNNK